ncbi:MAG: 50S ribosomal protein L10 [Candidatus Omnitrophica bacterium]|nr:50S ribosomal protein L10 [Candidatus Omnitrophota bacterium]MBI3010583.1 50S ribosomal protein L10 [Candidatus Omnitrophota bacterium]
MARVGRLVKESIISEIERDFKEQPNFLVMSFNRLASTEADQLRKELHTSAARLLMVKRRLATHFISRLQLSGAKELLEGSVGFILAGSDILPTAKIIVEFRKKHEEQLVIRGGLIDGQLLDGQHVEHLASLPSKPQLLAQVVGTIEAPMANLIMTIEQLISDVAFITEQAAAKKPAASQSEKKEEEKQ